MIISCHRSIAFLYITTLLDWNGFVLFSAATTSTTKKDHQPLLLYDFSRNHCQEDEDNNHICLNLGALDESNLIRNATLTRLSRGNVGMEWSSIQEEDLNSSPEIQDLTTIVNMTTRSSQNHNKTRDPIVVASIQPLMTYKQLQHGKGDVDDAWAGISISLWIRSVEEDTVDRKIPILTIGAKEFQKLDFSFTECDDHQIDLQLQLFNRSLIMVFRTSDTVFEPCQQLKAKNTEIIPGAITHVAMVLKNRYQQVFVNGKPERSMEEPFNSNLAQWNRDGMLELFSHHDQPHWKGRIYRLEVVEGVWDQEDVLIAMGRGVSPAIPLIQNLTYRIFEDAELIAGSHNAEWYRHPNTLPDHPLDHTTTVLSLNLSVSFLDEDVDNFLELLGIDHASPPKVRFFLLGRHTKGDLYYIDSTKILPAKTMTPLLSSQLVFIPEHNAHSHPSGTVFTTLQYCVALREILLPSQCLVKAFVNVIVDAVNDPPIAFVSEEGPYMAHEGTLEELMPLRLQGRDVDPADRVTVIEIVSTPRMGYLYLSVPIRRADSLSHGTLLSDLQHAVPGSEAFVEYRFTGDVMIRDYLVTDSFDFRVRDSHGSWSIPTRVKILVQSRLQQLVPSTPDRAQEDVFSTIALRGKDNSGLSRSIGFFVDYLPEPEDALVYNLGGSLLQGGDTFSEPQGETEVLLLVGGRLCDGRHVGNTSLGFRVAAFGSGDHISSVSDITERMVMVDCRVRPLALVVPQDFLKVKASNDLWNDTCGGYMYNRTNSWHRETCESAVLVDHIRVLSDGTHSERALVTVSSQHGLLTLNPEHRHTLRTLEDQPVMRSSIKFMALPGQAGAILSGLHFQSRKVGLDEIHISVEYGSCTDRNDTCVRVSQSIPVRVLPATRVTPDHLFDSFPWIQLHFTLTLLLLVKFKGKLRVLWAMYQQKKQNDKDDCNIHATGETAGSSATDTTTGTIRWQQCYDESTGFYYYLDLDDGSVTWDVPLEEPFLPYDDCLDILTGLSTDDDGLTRGRP